MLTEVTRAKIRDAFMARFHPDYVGSADLPEWIATDVERHVDGRFIEFQRDVLPWLESGGPLQGLRVLEIGCGTGSSTAALALAGAQVDAVDIEALPIEVAVRRLDLLGVSAKFHVMNGTDIEKLGCRYDLVVFFATYEHMTHDERRAALTKGWEILDPGGILCIVECPNRLWFFDQHTTVEPFYHWLPDEIAVEYASRFATRREFRDSIAAASDKPLSLARWGRAASYHDLELVLGPLASLEVLPGLMDSKQSRDPDLKRNWSDTDEGRFGAFLRAKAPGVPSAFFYPWLDVMIRKSR